MKDSALMVLASVLVANTWLAFWLYRVRHGRRRHHRITWLILVVLWLAGGFAAWMEVWALVYTPAALWRLHQQRTGEPPGWAEPSRPTRP